MAAGPAYHYLTFSAWTESIEERGWNASMLQWVDGYNRGRDLPQLARATATAWLMAWEWPDQAADRSAIAPRLLSSAEWSAVAAAVLAGAGALALWARALTRKSPLPGWAGWYSLFWLTIPAYAIYCVGVAEPLSLLDLWTTKGVGVGGLPWWTNILLALGILAALLSGRRPIRTLLLAILLASSSLAVWGAVYVNNHYTIGPPHLSWHWADVRWPTLIPRARPREVHSLWMPRYLGTALPAFCILAAAGLASLPGRLLRFTAIAAVCGLNLTVFGIGGSPVDRDRSATLLAELFRGGFCTESSRLEDRVVARLRDHGDLEDLFIGALGWGLSRRRVRGLGCRVATLA